MSNEDQPVQQPAAVVGQEPVGIFQGMVWNEGLEAYLPKVTFLRAAFDNRPSGAKLYTAPVPAAGVQGERERLRAEQAERVMPLIGPLLDAYEGARKDELADLSEDLLSYLSQINQAMISDDWQPDSGRDAALVADEERQSEAHKLARILFGMVEGDGRVEGVNIYADGYSAPDGDVFVLRAAELLIEQAAESKELTRYVEHFALAAHPAPSSNAAQQEQITLSGFQAPDDKSWWISIKHPFGYTNRLCKLDRDVLLAQYLAAHPANGAQAGDLSQLQALQLARAHLDWSLDGDEFRKIASTIDAAILAAAKKGGA